MDRRTRGALLLAGLLVMTGFLSMRSQSRIPSGYTGRPFRDSLHSGGPQVIPGRLETAYYDLGGEGVAYHDADASNNGSGVLNRDPLHQRPGVPMSICHFREGEGVDISYVKDFADLNHTNMVVPEANQLYIGWEEDGEWTNYTVEVKKAGRYKITALYAFEDNHASFSLNNLKAADLKLPVNTGNWHSWNKAEVGSITFPVEGLHLLTLHYNKGANLAYFDFEIIGDSR